MTVIKKVRCRWCGADISKVARIGRPDLCRGHLKAWAMQFKRTNPKEYASYKANLQTTEYHHYYKARFSRDPAYKKHRQENSKRHYVIRNLHTKDIYDA